VEIYGTLDKKGFNSNPGSINRQATKSMSKEEAIAASFNSNPGSINRQAGGKPTVTLNSNSFNSNPGSINRQAYR